MTRTGMVCCLAMLAASGCAQSEGRKFLSRMKDTMAPDFELAALDGIDDLKLIFAGKDVVMALQLGSASPGELIALTLSGSLLDGSALAVTDCITIQEVKGRPR